jgi:hypothetical protein
MNNLPRNIERALANYLHSESSPSLGGVFVFRSNQGAGTSIQIRMGHTTQDEIPEDGVIICECVNQSCQQVDQFINAWRAMASVTLYYPASSHEAESDSVKGFDFAAEELDALLGRFDLCERLTLERCGVLFGCHAEPPATTSDIEGQQRSVTWAFSFFVSKQKHDLETMVLE